MDQKHQLFVAAQQEARQHFGSATAFRVGYCFAKLGNPYTRGFYPAGSNQERHFENGYNSFVKPSSPPYDVGVSEANKQFAFDLLFRDPETDEELRPTGPPHGENGEFTVVVSNRAGTRRWKHFIRTEEV